MSTSPTCGPSCPTPALRSWASAGPPVNRAKQAAERAISSPMLETSMEGAKGVLLSVSGPSSMTLHEATEAARVVADHADTEADIIFGAIVDDDLGEEMKVTVIAAGFERRRQGRPATSRPSTPLVLRVRRGGRRPRHPDLRPGMNQPPVSTGRPSPMRRTEISETI